MALDKGAARSRKRLQQLEKAAQKAREEAQAQKANSSKRTKKKNKGDDGAGPSRKPMTTPTKPPKEEQSRDPELYKPKAIRSATALVWPCDLPPPTLEGITRVDLTNSGARDVSWLKGSSVRWLSLSGCEIENWEPVGTLSELTVLNLNECNLTSLPKCFGKLSKLKAFVAMNNPWTKLDEGIVSQWTELNSLILSHSPNLTSIPALNPLIHLTKLTFSHCPRLTAKSLPDLSSLPILKDVKMNNLPLLTSLPLHLLAWGTGSMSQLDSTDNRRGLGLESLDVGSCSLDKSALASIQAARLPNLRSITLHHNPLGVQVTDYTETLRTGSMPKLQIVDNKRIVERKVPDPKEKKKKNKGNKGKERGTGANDMQTKASREWGKGVDNVADPVADDDKAGKGDKKRKRGQEEIDSSTTEGQKRDKKQKEVKLPAEDKDESLHHQKKRSTAKPDQPSRPPKATDKPLPSVIKAQAASNPQQSAVATKIADPSALTSANAKRHSKNETGVFGVVDVVPQKGDKKSKTKKSTDKPRLAERNEGEGAGARSHGGIDLKAVFTKSDDNGLGVGGW